jgi:adenine-specific DNA-methyltransferase
MNYKNLSKEELLKLVERQEAELKTKKYGLVWDSEKEPEQVVLDCENNIPILQRVKEKEIKTDNSDDNILIEGDNYHALTCLNYTHKGKIDVIYIDPPYNTGSQDFVYNDKYIDLEDSYRHSKWLNFMDKRLRLANNLLKEDGFIFISIDDNEQAQLKLLCNDIFGENNFISQIVVESGEVFGTKAAHVDKTIVKVKDYVLVYCKSKSLTSRQPLYDNMRELYDSHFGTIIEKDLTKISILDYLKNNKKIFNLFDKYELKINHNNINFMMIINQEFRDYIYNEIAEKLYADAPFTRKMDHEFLLKQEIGKPFKFEDKLLFKTKTGSIRMYLKFKDTLKNSDDYKSLYSRCSIRGDLWKNFHFDMRNVQDEGNIDLKNGKKPIRLIKQLVKWVNKKDIVLLDFFAGSGSSGHAILKMNSEDGEKRKFILCTYNEENGSGVKIAEEFCYPRIKNVIKGYGNVEPLNGNLQYFKTDLIPVERIDNISDKQRNELSERAGQMIAIKENTFEEVETNEWYQIFENKDKSRKTAIYFREDMDEFESLLEKIGKTKTVLYVFSYSRIDKKIFNYIEKNVVLEDIPEPILEIYKEINLTLKDK